MNRFEIVADTSNDLPEKFIRENKIKSVSFYIRLDSDEFLKDQVDINREQLYEHLENNPKSYPKTSLPSVEDYLLVFKDCLDRGKDILCFTISSTLSGSYQSANVAAGMLEEDYPNNKIYIVDSESASLGVGLLIEKAVRYREEGISIELAKDKLSEMAKTTEIYIYLNTLTYLEKGGRIGKTGALAGNLLKIKPIVSFKNNQLQLETAVRGSKKAIKEALNYLDKIVKDEPDTYELFVVHGNARELAEEVKETIEKTYGIKIRHDLGLVSATVISHIGPGAVAIGLSKKIG